MSSRVPDYIQKLETYIPGKSVKELREEIGSFSMIKLASNENPFGPSPKALAAMRQVLSQVHRYPDGGVSLQKALADRYRVKPSNVILGGGSDSLMLAIVRAYVTEGGEVVTSQGSFAQFYLMPASRGARVLAAPMKNHTYDLEAMLGLVTDKTQLVFLANPNNPTGTFFRRAAWEKFYNALPKDLTLVMDEAYAEFVEGNIEWPNSQHDRFDNVITLRTFSKAHGLAGVRIGYGIGHEKVMEPLRKLRLPFETSVLALVGAEAALQDVDFVQSYIAFNEKERERVAGELRKLGIRVIPSQTNFLMMELGSAEKATALSRALLAGGVIVRPLGCFGLPQCLRVSIGLREENDRCLELLSGEVS